MDNEQNLNKVNIIVLHEDMDIYFQELIGISNKILNLYNFYLLESVPLINSYKEMLKKPIIIFFGQNIKKNRINQDKDSQQSQDLQKKLTLVKKYLTLYKNVLTNECLHKNTRYRYISEQYKNCNFFLITLFKKNLNDIIYQEQQRELEQQQGHEYVPMGDNNNDDENNNDENNDDENNDENNDDNNDSADNDNVDGSADDDSADDDNDDVRDRCKNCTKKRCFISDGIIKTCTECGTVESMMSNYSSFKDIDRIIIYSKYTYDRQNHFKECMRKFQGKQPIDVKVLNKLEDQFKLHDLVDYVLNPPECYHKITKNHIIMFLRHCGFVKYYDDVNYIYNYFTGNKVNDISQLEVMLLDDFNVLTKLYDKKFSNNGNNHRRKNFINTNYVLFQLLKKYNIDCSKEDFNLLKTSERQINHDDIIKEFFQELNWPYTPLS